MANYTILKNNRLTVEIQKSGSGYTGSRFDWTGFITQITLDDAYTFCVPEQYDVTKGTGGIGFCNEFGIDQPIGFDDITNGEQFPKIGVGLLTKDTEQYDFFKAYSLEPMDYIETVNDQQLKVVSKIETQNYRMTLTKIVKIIENRLSIYYTLENTGQKPIITNEYCHNFIGINKHNIGPNYTLTIPNMNATELIAGEMTISDQHITWPGAPQEDFYGIIDAKTNGNNFDDNSFRWQLCYEPLKVGVRDCSKFTVSKFALWGFTHVASPECFIQIDIAPNNSQSWERIYEFYNNNI